MKRILTLALTVATALACTAPPPRSSIGMATLAPLPAATVAKGAGMPAPAPSYDSVRVRLLKKKGTKGTVAEVLDTRTVPPPPAQDPRARERMIDGVRSILGDEVDVRDPRNGG